MKSPQLNADELLKALGDDAEMLADGARKYLDIETDDETDQYAGQSDKAQATEDRRAG
jgi:hypothetical protein